MRRPTHCSIRADGSYLYTHGGHTQLETIGVDSSTWSDRSAVEDGSAIVVERCPAASIDVELALTSRTRVAGSVAAGTGSGPVVEDAGVSESDAAR